MKEHRVDILLEATEVPSAAIHPFRLCIPKQATPAAAPASRGTTLTERTAGAWVLLKQMQGHPRRSADNHPGSDHVDEITVDWLLMSPRRQRSTPRAVPTAGRLAVTIAAVRGIAPEDVDRKTDPLWRYLGGFSTVYIDAARVRFLAGHHTRGLCIEEALAEIMANLEEESFGTAL